MIIDVLENAHRYVGLHPQFEKAFAYLREDATVTTEPGKYDVDGDRVRAIHSSKPGVSAAESILKFECHDEHIDIQYCIAGKETIGWKPRSSCLAPKGPYDPGKDVLFFNDVPDTYFSLAAGQFVVFFPEDVHAPMIGEEEITKVVMKVKLLPVKTF